MRKLKVLALGAHTDDIELGCGASLSRLVREGAEVRVVAFSRCETSLPSNLPLDTLEIEYKRAITTLSTEVVAQLIDFPVRKFGDYRQQILEEMVKIKREYNPDLVFTMSSGDVHQDHAVIAAESRRAFKGVGMLLAYELPWNHTTATSNYFIQLTEEDVNMKLDMIKQYESQALLNRSYVTVEFIRGLAQVRGVQSGLGWAESFEFIQGKQVLI